jgi:predicted component of type VI protein secretion system
MIEIESIPYERSARTPRQTRRFSTCEITIGRSAAADLFLDGDAISPLGLRVVACREDLYLLDGSENGTTINGKHGWGARPITENDDIRVGPYRLIVRLAPGEA